MQRPKPLLHPRYSPDSAGNYCHSWMTPEVHLQVKLLQLQLYLWLHFG